MGKAIKKRMHCRNIFRTAPDYTALAIKYKEFRDVCKLELKGTVSIDYKKESALRALTRTLLLEYFQLTVDFAPGSLVPTLPLRLNYILWIEDLVALLKEDQITGIDIGCGSSCIYSILGARKNKWKMCALESNAINIEFAQKNVECNRLQDLITIFPQANNEVIFKKLFEKLSIESDSKSRFQFCLCNPPFYNSDLPNPFSSRTRNPDKRAPPNSCHTGQMEELCCQGGEVTFVERIIQESLLIKERISIYTSMLGHKTSLSKVIEILQREKILNFCSTEFCQGNTIRWGIAWTFMDELNLKQVTV